MYIKRKKNQINGHNGNQTNQLCLRLDLKWLHNHVSNYIMETGKPDLTWQYNYVTN
jgi:hypothetical protein